MRRFEFTAATSVLLLIDVQERFLKAVPGIAPEQPVGRTLGQMLAAARLLGVPTLISEQYPQGLGPTLPHLLAAHPEAERMPKMHFSCLDDIRIKERLEALHRPTVVLLGIEAHVCVLHTAADLVASGREVVVCGDAVARAARICIAISPSPRMRDAGAVVLPGESGRQGAGPGWPARRSSSRSAR